MSRRGKFIIVWHDAGREPQCPPNPAYPNGKDVDGADPGASSCLTRLPYPAKRCGMFSVHCTSCGITAAVTTAGRPDDPRSLRVNCKPR